MGTKRGAPDWGKDTPHHGSAGDMEEAPVGEGKDPVKLAWVSLTCLSLSTPVPWASPSAHSAE